MIYSIQFLFFALFFSLGLNASELNYKELILHDDEGWYIRIAHEGGDIKISYGASPTDSGIIYKEIYDFEKLHDEIVDYLGDYSEGDNNNDKEYVRITLVPKNQPLSVPDGIMYNNSKRYYAADLWNGLFVKLLPVTHTPFYEKMNQLLKKRSPFLPAEDENDFTSIQIPRFVNGTREEVVNRMLKNLTEDQRVALGHPAKFKSLLVAEGNRESKHPTEGNRQKISGENKFGEDLSGTSGDSILETAGIKKWLIFLASVLVLAGFYIWLKARRVPSS